MEGEKRYKAWNTTEDKKKNKKTKKTGKAIYKKRRIGKIQHMIQQQKEASRGQKPNGLKLQNS
ncbi:hypothetical protein HYE34_02850 [Mycoplasmopsis bovis]|nr:hypothetical protein HYE34_02850 [Mycoplasmopsis bovis]